MEKLSDVKSRSELADFLRIPLKKFTHLLYAQWPDSCYQTFEIPKRSGGTRTICAPDNSLKSIQRRLADALYDCQQSIWEEKGVHPNLSHGFERGKSILTNARIHRNKRFVLNLDLADFFDTFHFGRVQGFFEKNENFQLPHEVAVAIAQLACHHGRLPQGAPSSPVITNLICQILDMRLLKLAKRFRLDYTRYADDLTFSTNDRSFLHRHGEFLAVATQEIQRAGFAVNQDKTRLQFRDSRQQVTGLVVNKKLNVDRAYYKTTRAMAHRLYTRGRYQAHGEDGTLQQLEGRFSFIDQLEHYNNRLDERKHSCHQLSGREEAYRAFLFYRYLFANEKPLIVTEGKTDIVYLKAALKSLYADYPNLIEKDKKGRFTFKISFFRRSKRWNYFFGIGQDGADAIKNLFRFFTGKDKAPNYLARFQKLCDCEMWNPVVLLFDHETQSQRPLKVFCDFAGIQCRDQDPFEQDLSLLLLPDSRLYLMTNPLVPGKAECEIEDLFPPEVLGHQIGVKTFCRAGRYDTEQHYGKEIFSQYVSHQYRAIDFSGFRPMLDTLNSNVASR